MDNDYIALFHETGTLILFLNRKLQEINLDISMLLNWNTSRGSNSRWQFRPFLAFSVKAEAIRMQPLLYLLSVDTVRVFTELPSHNRRVVVDVLVDHTLADSQ